MGSSCFRNFNNRNTFGFPCLFVFEISITVKKMGFWNFNNRNTWGIWGEVWEFLTPVACEAENVCVPIWVPCKHHQTLIITSKALMNTCEALWSTSINKKNTEVLGFSMMIDYVFCATGVNLWMLIYDFLFRRDVNLYSGGNMKFMLIYDFLLWRDVKREMFVFRFECLASTIKH